MARETLPETILWEDDGPDGVKVLTINRPERMNAIGPAESRGLFEALGRFRDDDEATVLIITGAGTDAFCAGADLKAVAAMYQDDPEEEPLFDPRGGGDPRIPAEGNIGPTRWTDIHKPIIAAVNGAAYAGGLEWACFAHIRVADQHASFGVTCRRWNVGLGDGGTQRLPRLVGLGPALELIITGRVIGADEAARIGLVNQISPSGKCLEEARALAHSIAALPQPALRTDLEAAMRGFGEPLEEGLKIEAERFNTLLSDPQLREGAERFVNRDHPDRRPDAEPLHRIAQAFDFAKRAHAETPGKFGSDIPFIDHLSGVARDTGRFGGDEDAVAAAYLHDTIEKTEVTVPELERAFGPVVARIVVALSEDPAIEDPEAQRLDHRRRAIAGGERSKLVYACDRLDGIRAMTGLVAAGVDTEELSTGRRLASWRSDIEQLRSAGIPPQLESELERGIIALEGLTG